MATDERTTEHDPAERPPEPDTDDDRSARIRPQAEKDHLTDVLARTQAEFAADEAT